MLGLRPENRGMRWVSVDDYICDWKTIIIEDIDQFIDRTHRVTKMLSNCEAVCIIKAKGIDITLKSKAGLKAISLIPKGWKNREIVANYAEVALDPDE